MDHIDMVGRAIDMAIGALIACLFCGAVTTGQAFAIATVLGLLNVAFDAATADDEDDF